MTAEELNALDSLRAGYIDACELERKAFAIRVENNRGMRFRNVAIGKAHAAMNDACFLLARASSVMLPRLLAAAREAETLRAERDALKAQRDELQDAAALYAYADDGGDYDRLCRAIEAAR